MTAGYFGGAFNPPHLGHLAVIRAFGERFPGVPLILMPNGHPNHRTLSMDPGPAHRLAMTRLLAQGLPDISVQTAELDRPGPHTTLGTLKHLVSLGVAQKFYLLVGDDWAPKLHTWVGFPELSRLVTWCVFPRGPVEAGARPRIESELKRRLPNPEKFHMEWLAMEPVAVSSSQVREKCTQGANPLELGLPVPIGDYIKQHQLYGQAGGPAA